jgi:hypothetical protein
MYQWDAEHDAGTRPTTRSAASCPRTRRCSTTIDGDLTPARRRTRPAGPARCSTTSRSTAGSSAAARSGSTPRPARPELQPPGQTERGCRRSSGRARGVRVRAAAPRRDRPRHRPLGGAPAHQSNIREVMAFPKTQSGGDLMLEAPSAPDRPSTRSSGFGSSVCRGGHRRADRGLTRRPATCRRCSGRSPRVRGSRRSSGRSASPSRDPLPLC